MSALRAKKNRRSSIRHVWMSAHTQPAARSRAKSRQAEKERQRCCQLQGWDTQAVPCTLSMPLSPGHDSLEKLYEEEEELVAACPCPREEDFASCPVPPSYMDTYFSGFPTDECPAPASPSLLAPMVLAPGGDVPMKTRTTPEFTLVLELEGTLLCCSVLDSWRWIADASFITEFQGQLYEVYVKLRPYVLYFLERISKIYEIFIFTTAKRCYAEKILDVLDPKKQLIKHCLFQEDCLCAHGTYWKDLASLGRDLSKTVALDHTMQGFSNQIANWLPGMPWLGDMWDQELLFLLPLLEYFSQAEDVRTEIEMMYPHQWLPIED